MRYNNIIAISLILVILGNLVFILSDYVNEPLGKKFTSGATAEVNLVVEAAAGGEAGGGGGAAAGGGGGGGAEPPEELKEGFLIEADSTKLSLKTGDSITKEIKVKNTGTTPILISLSANIKEIAQAQQLTGSSIYEGEELNPLFVSLDPQTLFLRPKEEKTVKIIISTLEKVKPGTYILEITASNEKSKRKIDIILEVESKKILFDATIEIPTNYRKVLSGAAITINPTIFNLADLPKTEVDITYLIIDFEGTIISSLNEKLYLTNQISYSKNLQLPKNIKPGQYIITMHIKYKDSFAVSSNTFEVVESKKEKPELSLVIGILIFLGLIAIIAIVLYYRTSNLKHIKEHLKNTTQNIKQQYILSEFQNMGEMSKINKKLDTLKRTYDQGLISKGTYLTSRDKLNKTLGKMENEYQNKWN